VIRRVPRIRNQIVYLGRFGNFFAVLEHAGNMKRQRFGSSAASFVERLTRCNAAGKIGEADAKIGFALFVQIGDVVHFTSGGYQLVFQCF
jgi:hypothetical protein